MPITNTLDISRKLEEAGFPAKQADALSDVLESTAQSTQQDLKSFIVDQNEKLRGSFEGRMVQSEALLRSELAGLETKLLRELRSQVYWFFSLLVAMMGATVALIKWLP